MVDRDLIVERQPFHDEVAECTELDPLDGLIGGRYLARSSADPVVGAACVSAPATRSVAAIQLWQFRQLVPRSAAILLAAVATTHS
jgi:hypothetical protein